MAMILSRASWSPNRNAMVIRRIENEHGCTLSSSDEMSTSGSSHAPPPLALQIRVEVAGLNFKMRIPRMNAPTAPVMIRRRFMLRGDDRLNFKLERVAAPVGKHDEAVNCSDAGGAVRVGVVDDADGPALAGLAALVHRRHRAAVARHAEGPFGTTVRPHEKGDGAHAGSNHGLDGNVLIGRVGHGELFGDVAVPHRDSAEVVDRLGSGEQASGACPAGILDRSGRASLAGIAPGKKARKD